MGEAWTVEQVEYIVLVAERLELLLRVLVGLAFMYLGWIWAGMFIGRMGWGVK